jgi:O-antigen/teichoic acid export membrane protein
VTRLRTIAGAIVSTAASVRHGLIAQTCSSAANFTFVVIAGQVLGPSGVGTLFVGFTAYLVLLGFHRSLVTEPLLVGSSGRLPVDRAARTDCALTVTLVATVPCAATLAGVGLALPGHLGKGMLLFAPWVIPALVQDFGRSVVFRDRSGASTLLSDATRLLTMAALVPVVFTVRSDWAVVGCWGLGAVWGAVVAVMLLRSKPAHLEDAMAWWKSEASRFGRWLAMGGALYTLATYSSVLALISILGAREFGGLCAVQATFAPLTLLGPALSLPGLPLVSRVMSESPRRALSISARLGALVMLLTSVYTVVLYSFPGLLTFLFGAEFSGFHSIIGPIGLGQILLAPTVGLILFVKAQRRGRALFWTISLYTICNVSLAVVLASFFGLNGAAWAGAVAALLYVALLIRVVRQQSTTPAALAVG